MTGQTLCFRCHGRLSLSLPGAWVTSILEDQLPKIQSFPVKTGGHYKSTSYEFFVIPLNRKWHGVQELMEFLSQGLFFGGTTNATTRYRPTAWTDPQRLRACFFSAWWSEGRKR